MGQYAITTGTMLGGSGAGYTADWLYLSTDGGTSWQPTYTGWGESAALGKLMNLRLINAIWADASGSRPAFDPQANTDAVLAQLAAYRSYGMLAATVGLQGGGIGGAVSAGDASAFNDDGTADLDGGTYTAPGSTSWWHRLQQVIEAMDDLGMVCILNIFYFGQDSHLANDDACREAVRETCAFLRANDYRNVMLDLVNEWTGGLYTHSILDTNAGIVELMGLVTTAYTGDAWRPPMSASAGGVGSGSGLTGTMATSSDVLFPHGNLQNPSFVAEGMAWHLTNYDVPVIMNEDHPPGGGSYDTTLEVTQQNLDDDIAKMQACFTAGGSWGGMFFGYHQKYPMEWTIGSSADISGGSDENYVRAVLDGMSLLTGAPPAETTSLTVTRALLWNVEAFVRTYSDYSNTLTATTFERTYSGYSNTLTATTLTGTSELVVTRDVEWAVRDAVTATRAISYGVRTAIDTDRVLSWAVRETATTTREAAWAVRAAIAAQRTVSWSVRDLAEIDRALLWDTRAAVSLERDASWDVRAAIETDRMLSWSVRQAVDAERVLLWNVTGVAGELIVTRALLWDVRAAIEADRAMTWGVRTRVDPDRALTWSVRKDVQADRTLLWDAREAVTVERAALWGVRTVLATTRDIEWAVRQAVATDRLLSWRVVGWVQVDRELLWNVEALFVPTTPGCMTLAQQLVTTLTLSQQLLVTMDSTAQLVTTMELETR